MPQVQPSTTQQTDLGQKKEDKIKKEKKEKKEMRKSVNLSLMVITISALFAIGNLPNSIVYVFQQYVDTNGIFYKAFSATANLFLFAVQGSDIWIYYNFNTLYRREFQNISFLKMIL